MTVELSIAAHSLFWLFRLHMTMMQTHTKHMASRAILTPPPAPTNTTNMIELPVLIVIDLFVMISSTELITVLSGFVVLVAVDKSTVSLLLVCAKPVVVIDGNGHSLEWSYIVPGTVQLNFAVYNNIL